MACTEVERSFGQEKWIKLLRAPRRQGCEVYYCRADDGLVDGLHDGAVVAVAVVDVGAVLDIYGRCATNDGGGGW